MLHTKRFIVLFILAYSLSYSQKSAYYEKVYFEIINQEVDQLNSAEISDLTLVRENATFRLSAGHLFLTTPVLGKVRGAVFIGNGEVTLNDLDKMAKDQLERHTEKRNFRKSVEYVFFMFTDSTDKELSNKLNFIPSENCRSVEKIVKESLLYLYHDASKTINSDLFKSIIENRDDGFFHSHFKTRDNEIFSFQINPYADEEILFHKGYSYINHKLYDTIIRSESKNERLNKRVKNDNFIRPEKYIINAEIDKSKNFSAKVTLNFQSRINKQQWLPFYLYGDLEVDSIKYAGSNLQYYKEDDSQILWIDFDKPLKRWHNYNVSFYYHGDLLRYNTKGWIQIRSSGKWFPKFGIRNYAEYDMFLNILLN